MQKYNGLRETKLHNAEIGTGWCGRDGAGGGAGHVQCMARIAKDTKGEL